MSIPPGVQGLRGYLSGLQEPTEAEEESWERLFIFCLRWGLRDGRLEEHG